MNFNYCLLLVIMTILPFGLTAASPEAPDNLRSFDKYNPIGTENKPYFAWYVNDADDNEIQTAYQILVASSIDNLNKDNGDIWNSGKVNSRMQNYVYAGGKPPLSATRYYWKVRTWDKDGNISPWSAPATFGTGLLSNRDWAGAKWIKRDSDVEDDYTYFRKRTILPNKTIFRATVYIAACHSYELYVNGKFIGKGSNNHYPQYSYYQCMGYQLSFNHKFRKCTGLFNPLVRRRTGPG